MRSRAGEVLSFTGSALSKNALKRNHLGTSDAVFPARLHCEEKPMTQAATTIDRQLLYGNTAASEENGQSEGETCAQARTDGFDEGLGFSAACFPKRFALSGDCAENNVHPHLRKVSKGYQCAATSVEGFIQQLAVAYLSRGYHFYVAGSVPEGADPRAVDRKLVTKYRITNSKYVRARKKKRGEANVQYLRFGRFFLLLATKGEHRFFKDERNIKDLRKTPIRFAGYSVGLGRGRDGRSHASVRIDGIEFAFLKRRLLGMALTANFELLAARFGALHFAPYAPVRKQYIRLLREVNHARRLAGLELLPVQVLPLRRRPVRPFG